MFWISSDSVVMSSFSFLILLIRMLSLCPLVCLAKGLSILLIFSKNHFLVLVDSLNFYLVDFRPTFDYFFLFPCGWFQPWVWLFPTFYSSWMNLLTFVLELLCVLSTSFFLEALRAMSFPLRNAFIVSHKFGYVVASFSLNCKKSFFLYFFLDWGIIE